MSWLEQMNYKDICESMVNLIYGLCIDYGDRRLLILVNIIMSLCLELLLNSLTKGKR